MNKLENLVDTTEMWLGADEQVISPEESYARCLRMAGEHYENFPVASRLLPRRMRHHVAAIYAFARVADDIADEGSRSVDDRLQDLDRWEARLDQAVAGEGTGPVFTALGETIRTQSIPVHLLKDLLQAFRMDARGGGYETLDDLLEYCQLSANPVGRLVLHLFGYADQERITLSDSICTGLQLVNFCQDVSIDVPRERINIPRQVMSEFGYSQRELLSGIDNQNFRALLSYLNSLAEDFLVQGKRLPGMVPSFRLRLELRATVYGGLRIAAKIREMEYGVLSARPALGKVDLLHTVWKTVFG